MSHARRPWVGFSFFSVHRSSSKATLLPLWSLVLLIGSTLADADGNGMLGSSDSTASVRPGNERCASVSA